MATAAVGSELTVVDVIGTMTVCAVPAQARLCSERLPMAAFARDVRVSTVEREAGLLVVIEPPLLPIDRVVAECTILAEAPFVRVVLTMATDAVFGGVTKYVRFVTLAAIRLRMFAQQREAGEIVVEEDIILPR